MQLKTILSNQQTLRFALALIAFSTSLAYTLLSLFSYTFTAGSLPAFRGIGRMSPVFADLRQLTHSSGCDSSFSDLLANTANCDPWNRAFNYTFSSLEIFRSLGIDASNTELAGAAIGLFGLSAALLFIFITVRGRAAKLFISTGFLLSFPFQLAVERGNYDLVVFGLCILVPLLLFTTNAFRYQRIKGITASVLSFAVVALKVFPIVGLAPWSLWLAFRWPEKRVKWVPAFILLLSCLGLLIQTGDISQLMANTPNPDGGVSFGLMASHQGRLGFSMGALLTALKLAIVAIMLYVFRLEKFDGLYVDGQFEEGTQCSKQAALLFSCMILIIWLVSRSWDYRLIFSLGIIPYFTNTFSKTSPGLKKIKTLICLSTLFILYEEYLPFPVLSLISDAIVLPMLIAFLASFLLRTRKSILVLT